MNGSGGQSAQFINNDRVSNQKKSNGTSPRKTKQASLANHDVMEPLLSMPMDRGHPLIHTQMYSNSTSATAYFSGRKLLRTAWIAVTMTIIYSSHVAAMVVILICGSSGSLSRTQMRIVIWSSETSLFFLSLLYVIIIRKLHDRHRRHGYLSFHRRMRRWFRSPERATSLGCCVALVLLQIETTSGEMLAGVAVAVLALQDVVCAILSGIYAYYVFQENLACKPPDALQLLKTAIRASPPPFFDSTCGSDYGGTIINGINSVDVHAEHASKKLSDRNCTLLYDVAIWQQDTIANLSQELLRLQSNIDKLTNQPRGSRLNDSLLFASQGACDEIREPLSTRSPENSSMPPGTSTVIDINEAMGDESFDEHRDTSSNTFTLSQALKDEREMLTNELKSARKHIAERDSEVAKLRAIEAAHVSENVRLRAMLHEWSSRSAKLEQKLLDVQRSHAEEGCSPEHYKVLM